MADVRHSLLIDAVVVVNPEVHADQRGIFVETWRRQWIPGGREMVQANRADRPAGSLVGLHYHLRGDGTARHRGVYIPPGVAHGFAALSDVTMTYLVDCPYDPDDELGLAWNDREVAADWGLAAPVLSARDNANPLRSDIPDRLRPAHPGGP